MMRRFALTPPPALVVAALFMCLMGLAPLAAMAQGQDSTSWARDKLVIATLLPGHYANINQAYFEGRQKAPIQHDGFELSIKAVGTARHPSLFDVRLMQTGSDKPVLTQQWVLSEDDAAGAVRLDMRSTTSSASSPSGGDTSPCRLYWRRGAGHFVAQNNDEAATSCAMAGFMPRQLQISEQEIYWATDTPNAPQIILRKSRSFMCHADIPGVGGGRDVPFERYDDMRIHDQGGSHSFTTSDGRKLALRLFRVDWPINNYHGEFARDSLALFVAEDTKDGQIDHGYAFIADDAQRIGINLKWILATCYLQSNKTIRPYM